MKFLIIACVRRIPVPILRFCRKQNLHKLVFFWNKYTSELDYQIEWVKMFEKNKRSIEEYWKCNRFLEKIIDICEISQDKKILDVGCGISSVNHFIPGKRYGIDPLADYYKKIYEYPSGMVISKGFGENINFPNEFFDSIFSINSLDHTSNAHKTICEIYRTLKENGYFILTCEIFQENDKERFAFSNAHPYRFTKINLLKLVNSFKFKKIFEQQTQFIPEGEYVKGVRVSSSVEIILVLKKCLNP